MRILVVGAGGMMGHMACRVLGRRHEVYGTVRRPRAEHASLARFLSADRWVPGVDINRIDSVAKALGEVRPDAVLNCVGIVKQLDEAQDSLMSIEVNSLFPHRLAAQCRVAGARLLHLSTDCVFSGRKGLYSLLDTPDPVDLYGRSKLLGEISEDEGLTIRTSIVGRQLSGQSSLFEWVLASRGKTIRGFRRASYTGLTTMALANILDEVLSSHLELSGVWQIASAPITKFDLLCQLNDRLRLELTIVPDEDFHCDRSLDGSKFAARTGIEVPSWDEMLTDFTADQRTYDGMG